MTWEPINITTTEHTDLVLPREVALKLIEHQHEVDVETASIKLGQYVSHALAAWKWGLQRISELVASSNEHARKVGNQLLQLFVKYSHNFETSI
jgi:hypothetical protein